MTSDLARENAVIADTTEISRYSTTVAIVATVNPEDMRDIDTSKPLRVLMMFDGSRHANKMRKWLGKAADDAAAQEAKLTRRAT